MMRSACWLLLVVLVSGCTAPAGPSQDTPHESGEPRADADPSQLDAEPLEQWQHDWQMPLSASVGPLRTGPLDTSVLHLFTVHRGAQHLAVNITWTCVGGPDICPLIALLHSGVEGEDPRLVSGESPIRVEWKDPPVGRDWWIMVDAYGSPASAAVLAEGTYEFTVS